MEKNKIKPIILVSSCLGFEATRYDGNILKSPLIERLRNGKYVKFITVCPEVAIGLGIPRETLRLVNKEEKIRLIQPETGKDLTEKMLSFSEKFISNLIADGFIFRADSPSMGPDHVKVYDKENGWFAKRIGSGLFTYEIIKAFEGYPLQDDKRLRHPKIQENFLTKLYTYARLRLAFDSKNLESLQTFHKENNALLFAHSPELTKKLEKILNNKQGINSKSKNYFILFRKNLLVSPSRENIVKSCKNLQKHLKGDISKNETLFLEDLYKQFISNYIPKEGVFSALQTLAIHYDNDYIKSQTLFQPFPPNLVDWDDYYMRRFRVNAYDSEIRHV